MRGNLLNHAGGTNYDEFYHSLANLDHIAAHFGVKGNSLHEDWMPSDIAGGYVIFVT
jgi:hypothetical protein